ncbi:MAG: hypothetical protein IKR11_08225, partial [Solobacterium sp.]|nr:hypothetical protein [Solobacterium sp.]
MKNKIWKTGLSVCMLIGNMNFFYVHAEENEENPDQNDVTEIIVEKTEEEEEGISPSEEITVQEVLDGETDHTDNNSPQNIDINEYEPVNEISEEVIGSGTEDRIHFIHLGSTSNDSFVIESNGHYGLIDTSNPINSTHGYNGTVEDGNSVVTVIQYLKMLGVEHLDFVLSTHSHSDHIGG